MDYQILQDTDYTNPRTDYDQVGTMYCEHSRYTLGDEGAEHPKNLDVIASLPLYLYDHSGITMSTSPFSCPWDSGCVGLIYIAKADADEWINADGTYDTEAMLAILESEVKEYDQYLTGDVWGYTITDDDGEEIDSCWGFYGHDYCEAEAKEACIS